MHTIHRFTDVVNATSCKDGYGSTRTVVPLESFTEKTTKISIYLSITLELEVNKSGNPGVSNLIMSGWKEEENGTNMY